MSQDDTRRRALLERKDQVMVTLRETINASPMTGAEADEARVTLLNAVAGLDLLADILIDIAHPTGTPR